MKMNTTSFNAEAREFRRKAREEAAAIAAAKPAMYLYVGEHAYVLASHVGAQMERVAEIACMQALRESATPVRRIESPMLEPAS